MLIQEFIERTGYTPKTTEEYRKIEDMYYDFPGDKDQFCKFWKRNHLRRVCEAFEFQADELEAMLSCDECDFQYYEEKGLWKSQEERIRFMEGMEKDRAKIKNLRGRVKEIRSFLAQTKGIKVA